MNTHAMIDFETLGLNPNTVVLSVGVVVFNQEHIIDQYHRVFELESQKNRTVSMSTIQWWMNQSEAARSVFSSSKIKEVTLREFTEDLDKKFGENFLIWGNGADFDIAILSDIFRSQNKVPPYSHRNVRCYRTVKNMFNIEKDVSFTGIRHNALADAFFQATCVMKFLQKFPKLDR